jgi:hypothetical protein
MQLHKEEIEREEARSGTNDFSPQISEQELRKTTCQQNNSKTLSEKDIASQPQCFDGFEKLHCIAAIPFVNGVVDEREKHLKMSLNC